jgi:hypothetical protein
MPFYVAGTPNKKNFDEHEFPTGGDAVKIRGDEGRAKNRRVELAKAS